MAKSETAVIKLTPLPAQSPCAPESIITWLVKSRAELGELKGYTSVFSRKPELLYSFFLIDAVDNMALDGTISTKEHALECQLLNEAEQTLESKHTLRLRNALNWAKSELSRQNSISETLLKNVHSIVTGKKTENFRDRIITNGKNSSVLQLSSFPDPKKIKHTMDEIMQFIKLDDPSFDPLVRSIIATAQFEALRPFEDSGSRTSRIFFYMLLMQNGLLKEPALLLSSHLRKNTEAHNRIFQDAVHKGNWCPYVKFMLHGISIQARETREKLKSMEDLYYEWQREVGRKCAQIYTPELVDALFQLPIISPLRLSSRLNIHYTTATRYLKKLEQYKFVENKPTGKYQLYYNKQLLQFLSA